MLLKKHKDRIAGSFSMMLMIIGLLIAGSCFLYSGIDNSSSLFTDTKFSTTAAGYEHPEQLKLSTMQAHQKLTHLRLRHKQLKTFLKKKKEEVISSLLPSWPLVRNFPMRADIPLVKPGYYLFLFRLTFF